MTKHEHDFCDFVDNRNGNVCEEIGTVDIENLEIIDYYRACPKHAKYLKQVVRRIEKKYD